MFKYIFFVLIASLALYADILYKQKDLEERNDIYYIKNINKTLTGTVCNTIKTVSSKSQYIDGLKSGVEIFYTKEKTLWETSFFNNKKHGEEIFYYENGKLKSNCMYVNDVRYGLCKYYYSTGELYETVSYVNGKPNGLTNRYYISGELEGEIYFLNGKPNGKAKKYYKDKKLKSMIIFSAGLFVDGYVYGDDGSKREITKDEYYSK